MLLSAEEVVAVVFKFKGPLNIEHETIAGTVKIRESGSITLMEGSMTGGIMVTITNDGIYYNYD